MIVPITKTFFLKVTRDRKSGLRWEKGIFFKAANNRYYRTTTIGPGEVKEVYAFKKKILKDMEEAPKQQGFLL